MSEDAAEPSALRALGLRSVFVAGPFRGLVDPRTGLVDPHRRRCFEALIEYFESQGCHVFNAHKREGWGEDFLPPEDFTRLDFDEISGSDVLVATPGPPVSGGTHIELGWASALGKPIVLLLERGVEHAPMVYGLGRLTRTAVVETVDGAAPASALHDALAAVCGPEGS